MVSISNAVFGFWLGQVVAALLAGAGASAEELAERDFDAPAVQTVFIYILLGLVYSIRLRKETRSNVPWWSFCILGLLDMEANNCAVKAYQYTSITSVFLLDSFSIPCALVLSWAFFKARYNRYHIGGVTICLLGVFSMVFADIKGFDGDEGPRPLLGDTLAIVAATLYACSNVYAEYLVTSGGSNHTELLAMMGRWGALWGITHIALLERHQVAELFEWGIGIEVYVATFVASAFAFYTLALVMLQRFGAVMYNLSLLTSDAWAVLARVVLFHSKVGWQYPVILVVVVFGILVFNYGGESTMGEPVWESKHGKYMRSHSFSGESASSVSLTDTFSSSSEGSVRDPKEIELPLNDSKVDSSKGMSKSDSSKGMSKVDSSKGMTKEDSNLDGKVATAVEKAPETKAEAMTDNKGVVDAKGDTDANNKPQAEPVAAKE